MDVQGLSLTLIVEEAGELLGISRQSAYRAASTGDLPVVRIGRRLIVRRESCCRCLACETRTA